MNSRVILSGIAAAALVALGSTGCASEQSQAELVAQARISKETAQQTALAKVPNGTVKVGELEKEAGKLQWSFDIAVPDSKDIKEVAVDAITGAVIGVDTETPAAQAKEAAEDAAAPVYAAGETQEFKALAQATLDALAAGKQTEMVAKLTDLETAWDDRENALRPKNEAAWTSLDKTLDKAISALRSSHTNLEKGKAALENLLKKLNQATKA